MSNQLRDNFNQALIGGERRRLTQVKVIHAVGHQDVVEEPQTRVVNAFKEAGRSVCSVYIFFCKDDLVDEAFLSFTALS